MLLSTKQWDTTRTIYYSVLYWCYSEVAIYSENYSVYLVFIFLFFYSCIKFDKIKSQYEINQSTLKMITGLVWVSFSAVIWKALWVHTDCVAQAFNPVEVI